METEPTPITELNPGDKLFVPYPADLEKPEWFTVPEVVTVRKIELPDIVLIEETGGLCLREKEFQKVTGLPAPEQGDMITFDLDHYDVNGFKGFKEHSVEVDKTSFDPMKVHPPKCIVTVDGEEYGIPFSEVKKLQKRKPVNKEQEQLKLEL